MGMLAYETAVALALLLALPALPFLPAWRRGLGERLGLRAPAGERGDGELVWVHAASVGEVRAAVPLVEAILRTRPASRVLLSTFTTAGRAVAREALAGRGPRLRFGLLPLDAAGIPDRVVRRERPALFVVLETELWPALLRALGRAGVPVLVANGRISDRTLGRYRRLRPLLAPLLRPVTRVLARTAEDARRFELIGVPAAAVRVGGNLKHHRPPSPGDAAATGAVRARLGADAGRPVLVAGSLRGAETGLVLDAFRRLRTRIPGLLLVVAPRHPGREAARAVAGEAWVRWSAAPARVGAETAVVLVDTVGELDLLYGAATVACVGGGWEPRGGHNLLEPALRGVPVVFGPDYRSFAEEGRALLEAGGGFAAAGADELHDRCLALLGDPAAARDAGARAAAAAARFGGAVDAALAEVEALIGAGAR